MPGPGCTAISTSAGRPIATSNAADVAVMCPAPPGAGKRASSWKPPPAAVIGPSNTASPNAAGAVSISVSAPARSTRIVSVPLADGTTFPPRSRTCTPIAGSSGTPAATPAGCESSTTANGGPGSTAKGADSAERGKGSPRTANFRV